jgi:hypothetical protein
MPSDLVVIRTFPNEPAALLARAVLEANGIPSFITSDDAGWMDPPLQFVNGVRLTVRATDAIRAAAALDAEHE